MLSLKKLIKEQSGPGIDIGDRKPVAQPESLNSKPLSNENEENPLVKLLKSSSQSEVLFALSQIQNECSKNPFYVQFIKLVTDLFSSPTSRMLDYAIITTLDKLAVIYPKQVARESYQTIFEQIQKLPAVEFVSCFLKILPHVDTNTIKSLVSQILVFLKSSEEYQFAACLILEGIPFNQAYITNNVFTQFLQSPILVTKYLSGIIKKSINLFGEKWINSFLIQQLTTVANSKDFARAGSVRAFLQNVKQFTERNSYSFLLSSFSWGQASEHVAIEILENCDYILKNKKTEFGSKLKDFALKSQNSPDKTIRVRVIKAVVDMPQLLPTDNNVRSFIKNACEDPTPEVRCTFIENIMKISTVFPSAETKEQIFHFFVSFFNDTNESVRSLLTTTVYYTKLGNQKLQHLMPSFIRFATSNMVTTDVLSGASRGSILVNQPKALVQKVSVKWRHFAACVRLYNSFPDAAVISGMQSMTNAVNQVTARSPHALKETCLTFYTRVFYIAKPEQLEWLTNTVVSFFAYSENYALREMFIIIAYTMCFCMKYDLFIEKVWTIVTSLSNDSVPSVRAQLATMLPRYMTFFKQQSDQSMERGVVVLNNALACDEDPYVHAAWEKAQNSLSSIVVPDSIKSSSCLSQSDIPVKEDLTIFHSLPSNASLTLPLLEKKQKKKINGNLLTIPQKCGRMIKCSSSKLPIVVTPNSSKRTPHMYV